MKKLIPFLCCLLVVTAACGGGSSLSSEDQKVVDDLAVTVAASDGFRGTADDAECATESLVTNLGTAYIQDNNLTDVAAFDDWDLFETELSREKFKQTAKGLFRCVDRELSTLLGDDADLQGLSQERVKWIVDGLQNDKFLDVIYDSRSDDDE
jgi:hypothetical protein